MRGSRIGALIRAERERLGLTQAELARLLPCHRALISRWERGRAEPNAWWLMRLFVALGSEALRDEAMKLAFRQAEQVLAVRQLRPVPAAPACSGKVAEAA